MKTSTYSWEYITEIAFLSCKMSLFVSKMAGVLGPSHGISFFTLKIEVCKRNLGKSENLI